MGEEEQGGCCKAASSLEHPNCPSVACYEGSRDGVDFVLIYFL